MSLGPVKPVMYGLPTAISEAPKEHVADDETGQDENRQDSKESPAEAESGNAENILKTAIEAEAPKVNILNDRGEKVVPDISGMVINILT